ncbi:hypothetical protein CHS0354_002858 [Potamilus streckersoni]|uniref:Uncharacterized protein n=1 Tax=Potamilus streckersoni TaxID=2493646 RepID=A0AAE0SMT2_9BIVA|nr:hypothetical protein CHS0354_002858 [Potamilus streckersoni]
MVPEQNKIFQRIPVPNHEKAHNRLNTLDKSGFRPKMKAPMRVREDSIDSKSYAYDSLTVKATGYSKGNHIHIDTGESPFVSARYNRRRASCLTVDYSIEEDDREQDVFEDANKVSAPDFSSRRMSAPELPPISNRGKVSGFFKSALRTPRSTTSFFKTPRSSVNRFSIHSDSSIHGYTQGTEHSRTSSDSSQQSRGRVLSADTDRQTPVNRTIILEQTMKRENISASGHTMKLEALNNNKKGMVATPRSVNYKRTFSKTGSVQSGNNNIHPQHLGHHSNSEPHITTVKQMPRPVQQNGVKTAISRNKSIETKKNLKNAQNKKTISVEKKDPSGTVNGMRRYASTLGLNIKTPSPNENQDLNNEGESDSEDSDKGNRIIEWIIGTTEVAEPPEEAVIEYLDEPPQRDTAIRIVYEGDT